MDWYTKNDMVCVPVYKDLTGQYTDDECDEDNCVEIPVPMILMKDFFKDSIHNGRIRVDSREPKADFDQN